MTPPRSVDHPQAPPGIAEPAPPPPSPTWRDPRLGRRRVLELTAGPTRLFDAGPPAGPVVVFVQGWMVNANHWRQVVGRLGATHRCITADWPTGAHELALHPDADLSPPGCVAQIAELLAALDVVDVTLVGNDSGGALGQIVVADHPERIGALLLTGCETPLDAWPPPEFAVLTAEARRPDGLTELMAPLADPAFRHEPVAYGLLVKHGIPTEVSDTYVQPFLTDAGIRHDTHRVLGQASESHIRTAAERLRTSWHRPTVLAWATEDPVFSVAHAARYAAELPDATFVTIDDSYSFTPEDQPARLAELIAELAARVATHATTDASTEVGR